MTKKEKREEALRIKKEIEAKKVMREGSTHVTGITQKQKDDNNKRRYRNKNSRSKDWEMTMGKPFKVSKHFDPGWGKS